MRNICASPSTMSKNSLYLNQVTHTRTPCVFTKKDRTQNHSGQRLTLQLIYKCPLHAILPSCCKSFGSCDAFTVEAAAFTNLF